MTPIIPIELRLAAFAVLAAFLAWVVRLIRRQRLSVRDSLAWLLTTVAAVIFTLVPETLVGLSRAIGIHVPANAFFGGGILYLAVNVLAATISISDNAARTRRLAQECALLRAELDQLRQELACTKGDDRR